jgi:hypothetical protein
MISIPEALFSICPGASWTLRGNSYGDIEWSEPPVSEGGQKKPTEEEVNLEIERLQTEYNQKEYQRQRVPEYPPITDYVDACYWASKGDTTKLDEYYAKCEEVKLKYPKSE